jgi:hypothetical protein
MERTAKLRRASLLALAFMVFIASLATLEGCSPSTNDAAPPSVPKDFPAAIPLYEGHIVSSAIEGSKRGRIWQVVIHLPSPQAMDDIKKQLADADLKPALVGQPNHAGEAILGTAPADTVEIVLGKHGDTWEASYIVTASVEYN